MDPLQDACYKRALVIDGCESASTIEDFETTFKHSEKLSSHLPDLEMIGVHMTAWLSYYASDCVIPACMRATQSPGGAIDRLGQEACSESVWCGWAGTTIHTALTSSTMITIWAQCVSAN